MTRLGPRQISVLAAVATFPGPGAPSRAKVANFLWTTTSNVDDAVRRLRRRGLLTASGKLELSEKGKDYVYGS